MACLGVQIVYISDFNKPAQSNFVSHSTEIFFLIFTSLDNQILNKAFSLDILIL